MRKKILEMVLALVMVCALLPTAALAVSSITMTEAIPCKYDNNSLTDPNAFSEGLAAVKLDGKWGFIDKTGKVVIPFQYDDYTRNFSEGLAAVSLDRKYGYIDKTGKVVIPFQYDCSYSFSEGLALVRLDGKYGYIDKTGREVVPCKYDRADDFSEGLASVKLDGKYGYVDKTGKEVIPCKYGDYPESFSEGLAAVQLDGKWGFIDKTGKEVIPFQYDYAYSFSEGLAPVKLDGKHGYIDKAGKVVIPYKYSFAGSFSEGLAPMSRMGIRSMGFIDKTGKEIVPCKYTSVSSFSNGLAAVGEPNTGSYIDKTGQEIVPLKYEDTHILSEGMVGVQMNGKLGFLSVSFTAYPSRLKVFVDDKAVEFQCYALKDANGNDTNYVKIRDLADILNGTKAQFQVGWDGGVTLTTNAAYTPNGTEQKTPFSGARAYEAPAAATKVNGQAADISAFVLKDDQGGGYTYYQLRDLGKALGFNVGWSGDAGVFLETDKSYAPVN